MTAEERIARIAQGFGQGIQNFQSQQASQEAQAMRDEALRRQQAIQEIELASQIGKQYGREVLPEQVRPILAGQGINFSELLASSPMRQTEMPQGKAPSYKEQLQVQKLERELAQPKIPPTQSMVATYAERLNQAEDVFNNLAKQGYSRADFTNAVGSVLPSSVQSREAQMQEQAERNFVNAVLRRESGAAISSSEFNSAEKQYFPRAGDAPEVIAQKARNRQIALSGLQAEAGPQALAQIRGAMGQQAPVEIPQQAAQQRITDNIKAPPAILGVPSSQVAQMSAQQRQALRQELLRQKQELLRQSRAAMR